MRNQSSRVTRLITFISRLISVGYTKTSSHRPRLNLLLGILVASLSACSTPTGKVQKWSISGVEEAELSGEVVDVLCELSGNCADQCGAGSRQLAIKTNQGTVPIVKDLNLYTGGAEELWPFCNQQLVINGQFTESGKIRFFQVQNVREPNGPWMSTTRFLEAWAVKNNKPVTAAKRWYRQDPRVQTILDRDGLLGLGPDADQ